MNRRLRDRTVPVRSRGTSAAWRTSSSGGAVVPATVAPAVRCEVKCKRRRERPREPLLYATARRSGQLASTRKHDYDTRSFTIPTREPESRR